MNCEKAEQLIPLFVEEDLDAAEMQQVSGHLETCRTCCDLAGEFQASQAVLHTSVSPIFDEAVFAEMRTAVQHAVARTATRPALVELLNPIWNWKVAFAAAAALLLVVGGLVIYEKDIRTTGSVVGAKQPQRDQSKKQNVSGSATIAGEDTKSPTVRYGKRERPTLRSMGPIITAQIARAPRTATRAKLPVSPPAIPEKAMNRETQANQVAVAPPQAVAPIVWPFGAEGLNTISPFAAQADNSQAPQGVNTPTAIPEREMLKMEIQTADPNVRIIWLTPKDTTPQADSK